MWRAVENLGVCRDQPRHSEPKRASGCCFVRPGRIDRPLPASKHRYYVSQQVSRSSSARAYSATVPITTRREVRGCLRCHCSDVSLVFWLLHPKTPSWSVHCRIIALENALCKSPANFPLVGRTKMPCQYLILASPRLQPRPDVANRKRPGMFNTVAWNGSLSDSH